MQTIYELEATTPRRCLCFAPEKEKRGKMLRKPPEKKKYSRTLVNATPELMKYTQRESDRLLKMCREPGSGCEEKSVDARATDVQLNLQAEYLAVLPVKASRAGETNLSHVPVSRLT